MVWNAIKLVLVMKLIGLSQTFALHHFGVACIISCGIIGKLVKMRYEPIAFQFLLISSCIYVMDNVYVDLSY